MVELGGCSARLGGWMVKLGGCWPELGVRLVRLGGWTAVLVVWRGALGRPVEACRKTGAPGICSPSRRDDRE